MVKFLLFTCCETRYLTLGFKWSSTDPRLAVVCGTSYVYVWTPLGCAITDLRSNITGTAVLKADEAEWNTDGKHLMVSGKDVSCICQIDK